MGSLWEGILEDRWALRLGSVPGEKGGKKTAKQKR